MGWSVRRGPRDGARCRWFSVSIHLSGSWGPLVGVVGWVVVAEFCLVSGLASLSREDLLALIAVQQRRIEVLEATVAEQAERIARLERQIGRNSGNSSMPPSSDVFTKPVKPPAPRS